ncbi:MAG TPA: IS1595 family transposase [Stellaceae bacterium]|nr:IS1595 family transposase [Stellaceae bacterium]
MSKSIFSALHFNDEAAAYAYVEARLWEDGRTCPHCGVVDRSGPLKGKTSRPGMYKCYACRKTFTVKIGTIFEDSHIAMRDWLTAIHLICSSKKGISSNQLHRTLGITLKSAWFLSHRIREAMGEATASEDAGPLGGKNKVVEADETYVGGKAKNRKNHVPPKEIVLSLVERGGKVHSKHVADVTGATLHDAMVNQINEASYLMTDEAPVYRTIGDEFEGHGTVNHSAEEYVRAYFWHTNTVEGFFSILKRGVMGTYHHISAAHLHRYLKEFDFRYNQRIALGIDDTARSEKALRRVVGKRLTYRTTNREVTA